MGLFHPYFSGVSYFTLGKSLGFGGPTLYQSTYPTIQPIRHNCDLRLDTHSRTKDISKLETTYKRRLSSWPLVVGNEGSFIPNIPSSKG